MLFPTFFNLSLNLAIRSSWSEPQLAPGLVFVASPSLTAKNIINLILVLIIWWCLLLCCWKREFSMTSAFLGRTLLAFALFHSVLQGQIRLLLQVSIDFLGCQALYNPLIRDLIKLGIHCLCLLVLNTYQKGKKIRKRTEDNTWEWHLNKQHYFDGVYDDYEVLLKISQYGWFNNGKCRFGSYFRICFCIFTLIILIKDCFFS